MVPPLELQHPLSTTDHHRCREALPVDRLSPDSPLPALPLPSFPELPGLPLSASSDPASPSGSDGCPTGLSDLDAILPPNGGLPRGHLTEISGPPSSGKTSLVLALLAAAQARGEEAALVDPQGVFFGPSAEAAGVDLERLLVVRPPLPAVLPPFEPARSGLRVVDHLLRSQGFSLVVLDLSGMSAPPPSARRRPLSRRRPGGTADGRPPLDRLFRVARLARVAETALVMLTETEPERSSLGSPVALRLAVRRTGFRFLPESTPPFVLGGARLEVEVRKSKFGPPGRRTSLTLRPEPTFA